MDPRMEISCLPIQCLDEPNAIAQTGNVGRHGGEGAGLRSQMAQVFKISKEKLRRPKARFPKTGI
jgi:hypothetical protein